MSRTGVVVDRAYLKHEPGEFHPERPERIGVLLNLAEQLDAQRFQLIAPAAADRFEIESCNRSAYVTLVEAK